MRASWPSLTKSWPADNYLNDQARVGQVLQVRGPSGRFILPAATQARRVVLIAGGSGITPLFSHASHLLRTEPETRVALIYGNRSEADIIFRRMPASTVAGQGQIAGRGWFAMGISLSSGGAPWHRRCVKSCAGM